jgi:hypothetical protein
LVPTRCRMKFRPKQSSILVVLQEMHRGFWGERLWSSPESYQLAPNKLLICTCDIIGCYWNWFYFS